ncbi:UDP-3-O-(3-hydroxymyristoyl)glucosamine N-acyltransferase [Salibacteraceae bacterium]|jgi:UDP-3-O-[3-hydroxymyristoyl] glucosamine N-acyltransferase|nr:UDP-3-O-(3-hydroxymyristoyl)glucosamine N-acyltransferase [Salibacteraceae bacterium]
MKLDRSRTLAELSELLNCEFVGETNLFASGINEIHVVEPGDIAFVDHPKYYETTLNSQATVIIINKKVDCPAGKGLLIHDEPFTAFNQLINHFQPFEFSKQRIDPTSVVHPMARIHPTASIGPKANIEANAIIHANVSIGHHCTVGENSIIHDNSTIGGDAFYYKTRPHRFEKLISCGRVIIEKDVEIGANCTIDRGVTGDTVIGEGTKFDNLVHIGHDTKIGKQCLFAAQVGIAGCVIVEDKVTMWGQVGCIANVTIGTEAVILAKSGIGKSLKGGKTYFGAPAGEARKKLKELATLSRLTK